MHRRKTLFLAGMPKPAGAADDARDRGAPRFVARVVAATDAIADDGERFLLSPAERHALVAAHLAGNRALVERLGLADPGPFLALPDPDAPWSPPAPITARELAAVRRAALVACLRGRNPVAAARLAAQIRHAAADGPPPRGGGLRPPRRFETRPRRLSTATLVHSVNLVYHMQAQGYLPDDAFLLEFGSNIGHFLKYAQTRVGRVLGIHPARAIVEMPNARGVPTVCDYFGPEVAKATAAEHGRAQVVAGRHCAATTPTRTRSSPAPGWRSPRAGCS